MPAPPEALVVCSLCQQSIAPSAYEYHLRQAHRLFTYRGVRRSAPETLEVILSELLTPRPSEDAWHALCHYVQDAHAGRSEDAFADILAGGITALSEDRRDPIIAALAPLAAARPKLVVALAGLPVLAARTLALACIAKSPSAVDAQALVPLLADRHLSSSLQRRALAALWPTLSDDRRAGELLDKLTDGLGRARAIQQLRSLERHTGQQPLITARLEELQENARLACSRCGVELRRAAMEQHLWNEHRLILDGLKTRDPWALIEEWLDACRTDPAAGWLQRCRIAVEKIDPENGPLRLARLTLAHGIADPDSRRKVLALARERQSACCPWCYALVNVPSEEPPPQVNLRPGRLSARGYEVRIDERGFRPLLEVRTPQGPALYHGHEPGRTWTIRGFSDLVAVPLVGLALVFACFWPVRLGLPIKAVTILLCLAVIATGAIRIFGRWRKPSTLPVLRYAWRYLVPKLHADQFQPDDAAFAAGLARLHGRAGLTGVEPNHLGRLIRLTELSVKRGEVPPGHLAALHRLHIEQEFEAGRDPVPLVVALMSRTFEGQLPMSFAQRLLEDWSSRCWTPLNLARLRVLLCDRAFEAGFEVQNLLDAGQNAPALGAVLNTSEPRSLAALRLLWSLRPTRPWDRLGDAKTAFELAGDLTLAAPLGEQPDLLLWRVDPSCQVGYESRPPAAATLRLTPLGVWLQGVLFRIPPRVVEVRLRASGCELTLGEEQFRSSEDLEQLSRDLDRWFRYGFHEFLPGVDRALSWQPPDRAAILRAWGAVPCPECGKHLLPRAGEVGIGV